MTDKNAFGIPLNTVVRGGGPCPDCDADQVMTKHESGVFVLTVRHDDTCPWLARYEARTS